MQGQTSSQRTEGPMDLEAMESKAIEQIQEVRGTVEEYAKEHPRMAVGFALGVGFILGGGLTPKLLFGVGAFLARRYAKDYARSQLGSITRGAFGMNGEDHKPRKVAATRAASAAKDSTKD